MSFIAFVKLLLFSLDYSFVDILGKRCGAAHDAKEGKGEVLIQVRFKFRKQNRILEAP